MARSINVQFTPNANFDGTGAILGGSGYNTDEIYSLVTSWLATNSGATPPAVFFYSVGLNDGGYSFGGYVVETEFVFNAIHTQWPSAHIYLTYPWKRSCGVCSTIKSTWGPQILSDLPFVTAGQDENVWVENGDNGATYTYDGVHYNYVGAQEAARRWLNILGY